MWPMPIIALQPRNLSRLLPGGAPVGNATIWTGARFEMTNVKVVPAYFDLQWKSMPKVNGAGKWKGHFKRFMEPSAADIRNVGIIWDR